MNPEVILSALVALVLAAVHIFGERLNFLQVVPRSRWLSAAGGVAVAYVFVHILPELGVRQRDFASELDSGLLGAIETHVYLVALLGLVVFYGLERLAKTTARRRRREGLVDTETVGAFWVHIGSYALYNLLVGYLLLHREETDLRGLIIYAVAMSLHFVVNDRGLAADHGESYHRYGRWIVAGAALLGWLIGLATEIDRLLVATLFAFLAGGVVMNVMKEELPEDRESRFSAFAGGAAVYAALLLAT